MDNSIQNAQKQISSFTGRLLRDNFGKGPESVFVSLAGRYLTIYIRNFLSPIEKVLQQQDKDKIIDEMRQTLMEALIHDVKAYIIAVTENSIDHIYYDWNLQNRSGVILAISNTSFFETVANENFYGRDAIEKEIIVLSQAAEKAPSTISSYELNPRTILVFRSGILVRIEKEIIRHGGENLLKGIKRSLEKGYLHNNVDFTKILNKKINDIFVDWDFDLDESPIILITEGEMNN